MPLEALESLLEENRGGVFFLPNRVEPKQVQAAARRAGYAFFHIEGKNITRKEQLLNHVATVLKFPNHFGHNWDALEECLVDMDVSDGDGFLIHYDQIDALAAAHPSEVETLVEILRDSVESWQEDGTPMVVLVTGAKAPKGVARLKGNGG